MKIEKISAIRFVGAAGAAIALVGLASCGSGGSNSGVPSGTTGGTTNGTTGGTTTGTTAGSTTGGCDNGQQLAAARASLNAGIRADALSNAGAATSALSTADTSFAQLLAAGCTTKDASAGLAITEARFAGDQLQALFGTTLQAPSSRSLGEPLQATFASGLSIWKIPSQFRNGTPLLPGPLDILQALHPPLSGRAVPSIPAGAQALANLSSINARLLAAQNALSLPLSDPNYVFTIADATQPNNTTATVKLGHAEFQALAAEIDLSRALANLGSAYNLNAGNYNFFAPATFNFSAPITPAQYFPASPFGLLNANGASSTKIGLQQFMASATDATSAINSVQQRGSSPGFLLGSVSSATLSSLSSTVLTDQNFLSGPSTTTLISGTGQSYNVMVNLPAFLNSPPADLKSLLPTLVPVGPSGSGNLLTRTFPDLTFGGLFPGGIPAAVFNPATQLLVSPTDSIAGVENATLSLGFGQATGGGGTTGGTTTGGSTTTTTGGSTTTTTTGGTTTGGSTTGTPGSGLQFSATRVPGDGVGSATAPFNSVSFSVTITGPAPAKVVATATNSNNTPPTMASLPLTSADGGVTWTGTIPNFPNLIADNGAVTTTVTSYDASGNVLATANSSFASSRKR